MNCSQNKAFLVVASTTRFNPKDHPEKERVVYYTPRDPPPGCMTLKINLNIITPGHFNGVAYFSDPQIQAMQAYYKRFGKGWIEAVLLEKGILEKSEGAVIANLEKYD